MIPPTLLCVEATGVSQRLYLALAKVLRNRAEVVFFNEKLADRHRARLNGFQVIPEDKGAAVGAGAELEAEDMERITRRDMLVLRKWWPADRLRMLLESRAMRVYEAVSLFLKTRDCAGLLVWNGEFTAQQAAILAATRAGVPVVYFENGYVARTMQVDGRGVNSNNSLAGRPASFYEAVSVDTDRLEEVVAKVRSGAPAFPSPTGLEGLRDLRLSERLPCWLYKYLIAPWTRPELYMYSLRQDIRRRRMLRKRAALPPDDVRLPERYAFLPLQVRDDTQMLFNSPWIKSPAEAVEVCARAVRELDPGLRLVVKEHPQDLFWVDYSEVRRRHPEVLWLQKYDIQKILKRAAIVVTINSSVGYQALLHRKPVITLGRAFYEVPGLTHSALNERSMKSALSAAVGSEPERPLLDKFLYHTLFDYFLPGSWRGASRAELDRTAERILSICTPGVGTKGTSP